MLRYLRVPLVVSFFVPTLLLLFCSAVAARLMARNTSRTPRIVWGSTPVLNYAIWARAMRGAGFTSETYTFDYYDRINVRCDWDHVLTERYPAVPSIAKPIFAFVESLFRYDVFVMSCDGYFLGDTPFRFLQAHLFRIARKKTIVIVYGGDAYIYGRIRSPLTLRGLLSSYPQAAKTQKSKSAGLRYWVENSDVFISGFMSWDGIGRNDINIPSPLFLDLDLWKPQEEATRTQRESKSIVVAHSSNHRGFKGTEYIIQAVEELKKEGLDVELLLIEGVKNSELRELLTKRADLVVEQLLATGHGLAGLESMALGLPTISNLEDEDAMEPFRYFSYFDECPIVSATPASVKNALRPLVENERLREALGEAGRRYVEKYHGLDSCVYMFGRVLEYLYGNRESLENIYHPILGEYPNRAEKIIPPGY